MYGQFRGPTGVAVNKNIHKWEPLRHFNIMPHSFGSEHKIEKLMKHAEEAEEDF